MKRGLQWPIGIVVFLGGLMGLYAYLFHVADDPAALVVPTDYYQRGVHFDEQMAQERRNAALGWRAAPAVTALSGGVASLRVDLRDAAGQPLAGATVTVVAMNNVIADHPDSAAFTEVGPGRYDAKISMPRAGMWELKFVVVRGAEKFTADEHTDLPQVIAQR